MRRSEERVVDTGKTERRKGGVGKRTGGKGCLREERKGEK